MNNTKTIFSNNYLPNSFIKSQNIENPKPIQQTLFAVPEKNAYRSETPCSFCGKGILGKPSFSCLSKGKIYCSRKCLEGCRKLRHNVSFIVQCDRCGKDSERKGLVAVNNARKRIEQKLPVYCSRSCASGRFGKFSGICTYCSQTFTLNDLTDSAGRRISVADGQRIYCSIKCKSAVHASLGAVRPTASLANTPEDRDFIKQRIINARTRDKIVRELMKEASKRLGDLPLEKLESYREGLVSSSKALGDSPLYKFLVECHNVEVASKAFTIVADNIDNVYKCKNIIMTKLKDGELNAEQADICINLLMKTKEFDLLKPVTDSMKNRNSSF